MIISTYLLIRIAVFGLAVAGLAVARHIHVHKQPASAPLVCPLNMDCHGVVHSDYSKFLGIPVETLGMLNYSVISLIYLLFMFFPADITPLLTGVTIILSFVAFLFSLYLVSVQIFILKKGCFWCYISATLCTMIFVLTLMSYNLPALVTNLIK